MGKKKTKTKRKPIDKLPSTHRKLGSGCYKSCWTLKNSNKVVLVPESDEYELDFWEDYAKDNEDDLRNEFNILRNLKKSGIPVPPVELRRVRHRGASVLGLVMPRYTHSRSTDFIKLFRRRNKAWRSNFQKSLESIFKCFKDGDFGVTDLQLLVDRNGKVMVTDPGCIERDSYCTTNEILYFFEYVKDLLPHPSILESDKPSILESDKPDDYYDLGDIPEVF